MAKRPNQFGVTVGGAQFAFSDQPVTRSRRQSPIITVNNDGLPVSTSAGWVVPGPGASSAEPGPSTPRSWRPTNGELVQFGILTVITVGLLIGSALAPIALVLFVLIVGFSRWSQRSRRVNPTPRGLAKYLRDVENAIKEIWRMAWSGGRGSLTTRQSVEHAVLRAKLTVLGHGDQMRCSNGKEYCGTCPNCRTGEEWG